MFNKIIPSLSRKDFEQDLTIAVSKLMVNMMCMNGSNKDEVMHLLAKSFHESPDMIEKVMAIEPCNVSFKHLVKQVEADYTLEQRTEILHQLWEIGSDSGELSQVEEKWMDRLSFLIGIPEPHLNLHHIQ